MRASIAAAAIATCLVSLPAQAEQPSFTIGFEGGYLFGDDHIRLDEQPEYPGDVNYGDGASAAILLEARQGMWSGFLAARYWAGEDEGSSMRSEDLPPFGLHTTTETVDTDAQFTTVDVGLRHHVMLDGTELSLIGGLRYLASSHDTDDRAVTEGFFSTDALARDRVDYEGLGPRIGIGATGPIGDRVSWFGEIAGAALFGTMDVERNLDIVFQGEPLTPGSDTYSGSMTVYTFDAQLGIAIALCDIDGMQTPPKLALGYRVEGAWNTDAARKIYDLYPETDDLALHHGPFARLTLPLN